MIILNAVFHFWHNCQGMSVRFIILPFLIVLSACSHLITPTQAVTPVPTLTPTYTEVPPTQTPTDLPEPSPTPTIEPLPFPTLEVDFDNLDEQEVGLLPGFRTDLADQTTATRYWLEIHVDFDPENTVATIDGMARIRFTNPSENALEKIVLMLWPNDEQYQAEMEAGPLVIEDILVEPEYGEGNLFLRAPLEPHLQPGETVDISLPFKVEASGIIGEIGLKRFGISYSIFAAPTFYPLVPRLIEGEWQTDAAPEAGDTTNSDIALYDVTINAPEEFVLVTSGVEVSSNPTVGAFQNKTYVSGPMRDFAFVLGPFEKILRNVGDVEIIGWVMLGHLEDGEEMMEAAAQQFSLLTNLVGQYPYPELDLVDVPGGFGGIEYPGLVFIGTLGEFDIIDPTVHEVAHQWFYGLIGNDQLLEPWLDEAVSSYWQVLYYENFVSTGRASALLAYNRSQVSNHSDPAQPIGYSVDTYENTRDYVLFVYTKGALFLDQLRSTLGEETFIQFLKTYYETYRYEIATTRDFQETAESVCSCDLADLFSTWVLEGGEMPSPDS
jgi:hypothetical protein